MRRRREWKRLLTGWEERDERHKTSRTDRHGEQEARESRLNGVKQDRGVRACPPQSAEARRGDENGGRWSLHLQSRSSPHLQHPVLPAMQRHAAPCTRHARVAQLAPYLHLRKPHGEQLGAHPHGHRKHLQRGVLQACHVTQRAQGLQEVQGEPGAVGGAGGELVPVQVVNGGLGRIEGGQAIKQVLKPRTLDAGSLEVPLRSRRRPECRWQAGARAGSQWGVGEDREGMGNNPTTAT